MKGRILFSAAVVLFSMLFSSAQAQIGEPESDSRVKNQLDALGLKYSMTDNGNYKVVFDMGEGRTQLVVIYSNTYNYNGMEVREITSTAMSTTDKKGFTQPTLFDLLERNQTYKIGAWQINGGTAPFILEFGIRMSANSSQSVFDELIRLAARMADELEQELTSGDDH
jgi:hypothetical protein